MKLTLITVSYNSGKTIRDTLESVLNQSYKEIEYIIIDGLSEDDTVEIVKEYEDKFLKTSKEFKYTSEKDKGLYDAMNKGIKMATGDIIGIINSDDFYVSESTIEKIINEFKRTNCDSLYSDLVFVDEKNTDVVKRVWKAGNRSKFELGWSLPHPTFFVKKSCYKKVGLYNDEYKISSDYDMLLRLLVKEKVSCHYFPETTVKMRLGGESTSNIKSILLGNRECRDSWKKNGLKIKFYTIPLKLTRKIIQKFM